MQRFYAGASRPWLVAEIRVYGQLAQFLGRRKFFAAVSSAAEAMRFLLCNFPQLQRHMADQRYTVKAGSYALAEDELTNPSGQQTIRIIPVVSGGGGRGSAIGRILGGIALVAVGVLTGGFGVPLIASAMVGIGASLALGGVASLLTPVPNVSSAALAGLVGASSFSGGRAMPTTRESEFDPQKSYSFSGIQNVSRVGVPISVAYGETIVGSIVISAGFDTEQLTA